jgi:NAD(P)-dependent dehydrogenase (short-subunit alcohol dehydrogenase family)
MPAPFPSVTSTWHIEKYPSIDPSRPELSAAGKTVLITGGGSGIGAETARAFAEAGASRIAILGRREQPLLDVKASINKTFPKVEVTIFPADITKKSDVDNAFAKFAGAGKIDIVISNAANGGPLPGIETVDPEDFMTSVDINLRGSLNIAQAFMRHAPSTGVAIETNSNAAHINVGPVFASYSVAKLAVFRIWDFVAAAKEELRVYHVHPGIVDTDMNKAAGGVAAVGFEDNGMFFESFFIFVLPPSFKEFCIANDYFSKLTSEFLRLPR